MQATSFDLSAVYAKQGRPLRRFGLVGLGGSVAIAAVVAYIVWNGRNATHATPDLPLWGGAGIIMILLFGGVAYWATSRGGVLALTVDESGLEFQGPQGPARRVRWSDPDFSLQVWDASALPEANELVQNLTPCRFGLATVQMKGIFFRTGVPREAYLAVLEGARGHGLEVTRTEDLPGGAPTFRIRRPGRSLG
jgi:hypothetical protein